MPGTILVVEDDAMVAESIRDVLLAASYSAPETASSGTSALEAAARLRPSLVLMDVQLDGPIDGIETAQQLRDLHGIRVIYLTGSTDDETLRRAKQTAPLGYLKKPFNARELRIAVEIALHQASLEAALAAREQLFATTLQSIGDAVLTTDSEGRVTFMNHAAESLTVVGGGAYVGTKLDEIVRLVDARGAALPSALDLDGTTRSAVPLPADAHLLVGAERVEVEGSVSPIQLANARRAGAVLVLRDVAERRRLERRVGMNDRLAAIGTMAAGMQHEINNPLASVVANVQFALDVLKACPQGATREQLGDLVSALEDASEGAERVRRTVEELRHFTRPADVFDAPVDLATSIDDAVRMTAHAVRHHASVHRDYGAAPRVRAEEGQLARVFTNLLLNAAQSTGDGQAAHHTILLKTRTDANGRAVAEITDDGAGIAPERLHRIFDPFFTTAPENAAMGLGLAVCHTIVTSLGGEIDVVSVLGKGTTFRVSLPPADGVSLEQARAVRPTTSPPPAPRSSSRTNRRGRVLVVDDEIAIGKALRRILDPEHDVTIESDARAALDRLAHETYDVVFCDLMMPNMSGMDFFDELTARAPETARRIVFLTGGAFSPRSEEFLRRSTNVCLTKPFTRESVSSAVRHMLLTSAAEPTGS
jgi:signal transduction histidine kinase